MATNNEVKEAPTVCDKCKTQLQRIPWNTTVDILRCENSHCVDFLIPKSSLKVPLRTMDKVNEKESMIHRFEE